MFRYVALSWDPEAETPAAAAHHLADGLRAAKDWRPALQRPGLAVFSTGETANANLAYTLAGDRGVVLGKLFRPDGSSVSADHFAASAEVSADVVRTAGSLLVERYWGRYVAFLESASAGFVVVRDPSGALPCFRMHHGGVRIFFSWLEDVLRWMPSVTSPAVDWECLAAHVAAGELTGHPTSLQGVSQVLPGECHPLADGSRGAALLWSPTKQAGLSPIIDPAQAADALREVVRRCAHAWASCYDAIVLRLSGGVDSSILACSLTEGDTQTRVTCLNYHSPGSDTDERYYARLAAARARRELVEIERDAGFRLEQVLDVARMPSPANYLGRFGAHTDANLAAAVGAPALFTGSGGDQLFLESATWWPAADYLRLQGPGIGFLWAAMNAARLGQVSVWRAARLAIADRFRSRPPAADTARPWALATDTVWETLKNPGRFQHPVHGEPSDLPIGKLIQAQQVTHFGGYYDPYRREAAPEQVHPLLSQPLIELCLRIPTWVLTVGGRGRGLARRAFAADLPEQIAGRRSKGGLQEQLAAVLASNPDFVRAFLLEGRLAASGLVDRSRLERALSGRPGAVGRPGEIHMYVAVEAWLQRWPASPGRP
jgi:asparagine synthase (glutamine-hydrolysing)